MISSKKKVLMGILLTILLGAIGSGLWDVVLKSFFNWMGRLLLTFVTLGLTSASNRIYQNVSKGLHEVPILHIFLIIMMIFLLIPVMLLLSKLLVPRLSDKLSKLDEQV